MRAQNGPALTTPQRPSVAAGNSRPAFETVSLPEPEEQGLHQTSQSGTEVCRGTVKLLVEPNGSLRRVSSFVVSLNRAFELQLLQLKGDYQKGMDISVGLRTPMSLEELLLSIDGVDQVEVARRPDQDGHEPLFNVRLTEAASPK